MEIAAESYSVSVARTRWKWLIPLGLFLLGLALYAHTSSYELMFSWDDNRYIAENMLLRNFSLNGLYNIFSQVYFAAYIPVTIATYWVEFKLWGMNPAGYHVVNTILGALNGVLVYYFLLKLLKNRNVALMAALLWIVHPLQVETVAWVAERKSLLAMFFTLLSFIIYMRSANEDAPSWSVPVAWLLYLLAALSKPAVVGVPFLFMIYDYFWAKMSIGRVLLRSIVPLIIGGGSAIGILLAHSGGGGIKTYWGGSPVSSALLMLMVYWDYVTSFVAPWTLNNFYQYPPTALSDNPISVILGSLLLVGAIYVAWKQPFGKPFSFFAICWIVLFMLPVSNIVPIAIERADRYMYFPSVVIFAAFAIVIDRLWNRLTMPQARYAIGGVFAAIVVVLMGFAVVRSFVWQNEGALWIDNLRQNPVSETGWLNLGVYYYNKRLYADAIPTFEKLLSLNPTDFKGNRFLANIAINEKRYADAIPFYRTALAARPTDPISHNYLALAYYRLGAYKEAIAEYQLAIKYDSTLTQAYANLGSAALRDGQYKLSEEALRVAVERNPEDANSTSDLCAAMVQNDKMADAIGYCETAVKLQPKSGLYVGRLASLYLDSHQPDKALPVAQQAVAVAPELTLSYRVLGEAYAGLGMNDKAIEALQRAVDIDPTNSRARQILDSLTAGS